jgi:LmbE family N-acetylglucosaminyl deacetylase
LSTHLYAEQKRGEADLAAARLGVKWRSLDLPDAFLPSDEATALAVCDVMRELKSEVVITHWQGSWHKDHRAAAEISKMAVFYASLPTLKRALPAFNPSLLLFGENWEDDEGFTPTYLVDVTPGFEPWRDAVEKYELARGLSSFPYVDYYSALYRLRGCIRGTTYAQAFAGMSHSWNAGAGLFMPALGE